MGVKDMKCMFFSNGNTAFFYKGEQQSSLQKSWLRMYVDFLLAYGVHPDDVDFILPNGDKAIIIKTENDYTWKIKESQ